MKTKLLVLTVITVLFLLTACDVRVSEPSVTIPLVDVSPDVPMASTSVPVDPAGGNLSAIEALQLRHAMQRWLDLPDVSVEGLEAIVWDSSCLGAALEDVVCQPGSVPGYRLTLTEGADRYVYHSDESGEIVHLVEAPPVDVGATLLEWREAGEACYRLVIGASGVLAFGECGLPLMLSPTVLDPQTGDFGALMAAYTPFEADTAAGHVALNGAGATVAAPAEQRMVAEWAKNMRAVVWSAPANDTLGLVITWSQTDGCARVNIWSPGVAYGARCDVNHVYQELGQIRLNAEQLETFYRYYDTYQGFEWTGPTGDSSITMEVAGHGEQQATLEQQTEVGNFVQDLLYQFPTQGYEFPAP